MALTNEEQYIMVRIKRSLYKRIKQKAKKLGFRNVHMLNHALKEWLDS